MLKYLRVLQRLEKKEVVMYESPSIVDITPYEDDKRAMIGPCTAGCCECGGSPYPTTCDVI